MNNIIRRFLIFLVLVGQITFAQSSDNIINKKAPLFRLPDQNSSSSSMVIMADEFTPENEHALVVSFFASWCLPCRKELPFLQHMADSLSSEGLRLIAVSVDSAYDSSLKELVNELKLTCPVIHDKYGIVAKRYECGSALPYTVFINRKGIVSSVSVGYSSSKKNAIKAEIKKILGK